MIAIDKLHVELDIDTACQARKVLDKIPGDLRALILGKIEAVAADPQANHSNVTRLQGRPEYRLCVHDWRVIYRVQDDRLILLVIKIGTRGQVYE